MSSLARWAELWAELGLPADPELHADLRLRYSEASRAYHNLHHVMECLDLLGDVRALARRPAEIELAIWFHDAIYDPRRHDNEARSADWAQRALRQAGASDAVVERIRELVLVTRHDQPPADPDQELMLDIDLGILGARPSRYDEYERQIRAEYHHVPTPVFRAVRRRLLEGFLARPGIYHAAWFRERRERQAHSNLERALRQLSRGRLAP